MIKSTKLAIYSYRLDCFALLTQQNARNICFDPLMPLNDWINFRGIMEVLMVKLIMQR